MGSKFGWKKLGRRINYMSSLTMTRLWGPEEDLVLGGLGLRFVVAGLAEQDVAAQSTNAG